MQNSSSDSHSRVQRSTTLNRKYVKRPVSAPKIRTPAQIQAENLKRRQALAARMNHERVLSIKSAAAAKPTAQKVVKKAPEEPIAPAETHPIVASARKKLAAAQKPAEKPQISLKERKERAIESALKKMETAEKTQKTEKRGLNRSFFTIKRVSLAVCCSLCVVAIATYFVKVSMPSLSVQFAAAQSGIDALYPTYIPKGFALADTSSEDEKVTMTFKNNSGNSFTLSEEKSSWNSSALEANFVKSEYNNNYSTVREQGLTIYISGSNCAWVNGGKKFTITSDTELTKTQLVSIATSL